MNVDEPLRQQQNLLRLRQIISQRGSMSGSGIRAVTGVASIEQWRGATADGGGSVRVQGRPVVSR